MIVQYTLLEPVQYIAGVKRDNSATLLVVTTNVSPVQIKGVRHVPNFVRTLSGFYDAQSITAQRLECYRRPRSRYDNVCTGHLDNHGTEILCNLWDLAAPVGKCL